MGAMHEGHASLMRRTRAEIGPDAPLVVSLFVNPLQFGPNEDLARYPRTFDEDLALCAAEGVDIVFAPSVDEVYPGGTPQVTVDPGPLADVLEGATRPGHYVGVLTVVAKLFGLVRPDVTVFGEKDYQQLALVRRMSERPLPGRRGAGRRDRPRARRPGAVQPQPVPRPRAAPAGRRPQPGAARRAGGRARRVRRRAGRRREGARRRGRRRRRLPGRPRNRPGRAGRGRAGRGPRPRRRQGRHHPPDRQPARRRSAPARTTSLSTCFLVACSRRLPAGR